LERAIGAIKTLSINHVTMDIDWIAAHTATRSEVVDRQTEGGFSAEEGWPKSDQMYTGLVKPVSSVVIN
jgi:hypothetical protein